MTSQEARQQVEICERSIVDAYSELIETAVEVGDNAGNVVSGKEILHIFLAIFIGVFGLFISRLQLALGIIIILGDSIVTFFSFSSVASQRKEVDKGREELRSIIDSNSKI